MRAIARRHAYVLVRSPHRLFDVSLWPLVDVLLFGSLAAFVGTSGSTPAREGVGLPARGHRALARHLPVADRDEHRASSKRRGPATCLNLMVTPLREVEYLGGVALFGMVKLVIGVGVMVLGALAFFSFHTWSLGFGLDPDRRDPARRRLGDLAVRDGARAAVRHGRRGARVGRHVRAAAALGRLLSDRRRCPPCMQPLALALPTTHAFTALRSLVDAPATRLGAGRRSRRSGRSSMLAPRDVVPRARCSQRSASAATSPATRDPSTARREVPGRRWPGTVAIAIGA